MESSAYPVPTTLFYGQPPYMDYFNFYKTVLTPPPFYDF